MKLIKLYSRRALKSHFCNFLAMRELSLVTEHLIWDRTEFAVNAVVKYAVNYPIVAGMYETD